MEGKLKHQNSLLLYRRRIGFSQKQVARLLGHKSAKQLSRYENGKTLPPLPTALQLEIIYRVPVAFLYGRQYDAMREEIRALENRFTVPGQAVLF